jgi:hypothetical protein
MVRSHVTTLLPYDGVEIEDPKDLVRRGYDAPSLP